MNEITNQVFCRYPKLSFGHGHCSDSLREHKDIFKYLYLRTCARETRRFGTSDNC